MGDKLKYRKKPTEAIVAVQLDLDTDGFTYQKWGGTQVCRKGDWLVNNNGSIYTINRETFDTTYTEISPGMYQKDVTVWAEVAKASGVIKTRSGTTDYSAGDYLVYNDETGEDAYAVSRGKFEAMYEAVKDD